MNPITLCPQPHYVTPHILFTLHSFIASSLAKCSTRISSQIRYTSFHIAYSNHSTYSSSHTSYSNSAMYSIECTIHTTYKLLTPPMKTYTLPTSHTFLTPLTLQNYTLLSHHILCLPYITTIHYSQLIYDLLALYSLIITATYSYHTIDYYITFFNHNKSP